MQLKSFNLVGTGAALAIADAALGIPKLCKWFQFLNVDGTLTIGSEDVDATHGYPITATGANFQPPMSQSMEFYDLERTYFFLSTAANGVLLCAV
jgi:hypothetical protein